MKLFVYTYTWHFHINWSKRSLNPGASFNSANFRCTYRRKPNMIVKPIPQGNNVINLHVCWKCDNNLFLFLCVSLNINHVMDVLKYMWNGDWLESINFRPLFVALHHFMGTVLYMPLSVFNEYVYREKHTIQCTYVQAVL